MHRLGPTSHRVLTENAVQIGRRPRCGVGGAHPLGHRPHEISEATERVHTRDLQGDLGQGTGMAQAEVAWVWAEVAQAGPEASRGLSITSPQRGHLRRLDP